MEITRGKVVKAQKTVLYGPEGIGKTTFASQFPDPVFCDTEGGSHHIDVARAPTPSSWTMLLETVRYFIASPMACKTFVLDTADWAERMCVKHVCDQYKQQSVEGFGYGKGYVYVYEEFGKLLDLLTELINKGVNVVVTAHAQLKKFEQPDEMGSYDRYELKLGKKTGAHVADMLKEWCDLLLFINYKTLVINVDGQGATKGKNKAQGGKRVMYTTHTPSWDAKNRHGLPDELLFEYSAIAQLFTADLRKTAATPPPPAPERREQPAERADIESAPTKPEATPPASTPPTAVISEGPQGQGSLRARSDTSLQQRSADAPRGVDVQTMDDGIPQALRDLMTKDNVTEQEIMFAVAGKGYYPNETPIAKYDTAFVSGVLVAAWLQVRDMVYANREGTPF